MGNKPTRDDNSTPDSVPISLISTAEGSFGLDGAWKANAVLAVLETLFRVPCLGECILGAQIDQKCKSNDHDAIYELQLLFDARANAAKGAIISSDSFLRALIDTQSTIADTAEKVFDENDPSHIYSAISDLIVSSLPELRGIFYGRNDHKLLIKKDVQPKAVRSNGICISLVPYFEVNVGNEIISLKLPRPKILENTPIFVVTTSYPLVTAMGQKARYPISCYSLAFPTSLNLMKLTPPTTETDRCDLIYQLHSVVAEVQGSNGSRNIKSFYRTGPDVNAWCESAAKPIPRTLTDMQALGAPRSNSCVRVLIYIQTDLSLMTSSHLPIAGMKIFKEASTNPKLNAASGIPILQQITGISGSSSPVSPLTTSTVASCNPKGVLKATKAITNGFSSSGFSVPLGPDGTESPGGQPMEEELEEEDEEEDEEDDEEDEDYEYESDGDEDDYDSESYESPEYEDEAPAECQCPTCRRERDQKLRELARLKSEKELLEQVKKEKLRRLMTPKTPGTGSVAFQPTVVKDAERVTIDGKSTVRDIILQTITCMEGYSNKSNEELRFEDYYLKSPALFAVKKALDEEVVDRGKEATANTSMEKEEKAMKTWCHAADRSWAKYTVALSLYNDGLFDQASELFTLALRICYSGPHSVFCYYYRALCGYPKDPNVTFSSEGSLKEFSNVCADLVQCILIESNHSEAHYLLGSLLLKAECVEWERAETHLEKAFALDSGSFSGVDSVGAADSVGAVGSAGGVGGVSAEVRMSELVKVRVGAARTRLINTAEVKKTIGNAALARGAYTEAERLYSVAIEICPDCEKSHIYYCNRAAARCEIGMRLDPSPDIAFVTLQTAIADCDRSLELQPGYAKAVFRRLFCFGVAAFCQNDLEGSLKHLTAALELDPTNALVKQEMRKVTTAIDVIKAKERVIEIEKEVAAREALRAEEKEKEKRALEEKKAREELIRRGKAEKLEQERVERARIKAEREAVKNEKGKAQAEEDEKEKEEKRMEKEKQRVTREQEKAEERDRKKIDREREKVKAKEDKDKKDKELFDLEEKERARKRDFAMEMNRVKSVIVSSTPVTAFVPMLVPTVTTPHTPQTPHNSHTVREMPVLIPLPQPGPLDPKPDYNLTLPVGEEDPLDTPYGTSAPFSGPALSSTSSVSAKGKGKGLKTSSSSPMEVEIKTKTLTPEAPIPSIPAPSAPTPKKSPVMTLASIGSSSSLKAVEKTAPPPPVAAVVAATTLASASKTLLTATTVMGPSITRIVECPQTRVGIVIGTKGSVIMEMMKKTSCKIVINQEFPDGVAREIIFSGTKEQIEAAKVLVNAVIVHGPIILANVELLNQAAAAAIAISNPPVSTSSGVLHARQTGTGKVAQASAQLIRTNNIGVPGVLRMEPTSSLIEGVLSVEEKERRVRKMMMVPPTVTHQFDESDTLCVICAEPFRDGERILAFGACNHKGPCSICTVRMRAIGGDFSCALCRQDMGCVVCTTRDVPFKDFNLPANPSPDLFYHTKGRMFIPRKYYIEAVSPLFEFKCRECRETFNDGDLLRSHYESMHKLIQCVLCAHFKQAFPSEQAVYGMAEYERHMREGSADGSDGQGHPDCAFCQVRYYDKTELYKHVTKSHQTCHLCSRDGTQYKYYRDYKMLEDHFRKEHFACDEHECVEKKNIVFKSLFDLQAHKRSAHSQAAPAVTSEGSIGGDWDFPYLQGSSSSGQTSAQSLAASLRRTNGTVGKVSDPFSSSPEAFPSLGSTRRTVSDLSSNPPLPVMTPIAPAPVISKAPIIAPPAPPPIPILTPAVSARGYDDMDSGFDYSLASLSLNATATPYAPSNPPPTLILAPVAAKEEHQSEFVLPRAQGHQSLFGDSSLHPSSSLPDSRLPLPIRHQSPSIGDLTSMLSGITSHPPSFSLTNQFSQPGPSSLNINDFFSPNSNSRGMDFGNGLGGAFSPSSFSNILGREDGQSQLYSLPFSDLSGFGAIGGRNTSRLPLSLLHDDEDDDDDEGVFSDDFHMKMLADDDEDEKVEVSLGAYRSGQLTYEKVMELSRQACDDYGLDSVCRSYFYDSPIEMQIAVLASLTSVPPGLRANENTFVKTSFQNMALHPRGLEPPTLLSLSHDSGLSHNNNINRGHEDQQDSFFADISSLSSSLMAKDSDMDLPRSMQKVKSNSYESLLLASRGMEGPGSLMNGYPKGLGGQNQLGTTLDMPILSSIKHPLLGMSGQGVGGGAGGVGGVGGGVGGGLHENSSMSAEEQEEESTLLAAQQERAQFPSEFIDKLVAVLKRCGSDGLLGSQFPEAFKKLHGEKLVLENKKGRKLKLIHVLDGHPNVRKEKLGTYKWYYKESAAPIGTQVKVKTTTKAANKAAKLLAKGGQVSPPGTPITYSGMPGIEVDLLPADSFPCVAWLREEDMHMYRWAGNAKEWTEYAMRLRPDIASVLEGPVGEDILQRLRGQSGCVVSVGSDMLNGRTEKFLVFVRGDSGQPSNGAMTLALEVFSQQLRGELLPLGISDSPSVDDEEEMRQMGVPSEGRVQKVLEIPQGAVGMITGKSGKLYAMRKKSGAYIALISKNKTRGQTRLTISGTAVAVESAMAIVKQALTEYEADLSA